MHVTLSMQNTEETIAKYAVDVNLFRLGSTNTIKKYPALEYFLVGGEASLPTKKNFKEKKKKKFNIFTKKNVLFFFLPKSVQICMKDAEYAETNEKSIL